MNEQKRSRLLSEFEKVMGYSSNEFREPDWIEFDGFIQGYIFAEKEIKDRINTASLSNEDITSFGDGFEHALKLISNG